MGFVSADGAAMHGEAAIINVNAAAVAVTVIRLVIGDLSAVHGELTVFDKHTASVASIVFFISGDAACDLAAVHLNRAALRLNRATQFARGFGGGDLTAVLAIAQNQFSVASASNVECGKVA